MHQIKPIKKKIITLLQLTVIMVSCNTTITAQTSSTVFSTAAGAKLIIPITLTQTAPLYFGSIIVTGGLAGTCLLPSNSITREFAAGLSASAVLPSATNAAYNVSGMANASYALTLPVAAITVTSAGGATMDITLMTARFIGKGADAVVSTLSIDGTDSFTLGGTLTALTTQAGGIYSGTFNVTVAYN